MVDHASGSRAGVVALPVSGEVLTDARGEGRWMRVTWHDEADLVVLSLWRQGTCVGTLRLERSQVPALVGTLVDGLAVDTRGGARGGS